MALMNSMTVVSTTFADSIPKFWDTKVLHDAIPKSFWASKAGKEGAAQPVVTKTNFLKTPGDTVYITITSRSHPEAKTGESTLENYEAQFGMGQFSLSTTYKRQAWARTELLRKQSLIDYVMNTNRLASSWAANEIDFDIFQGLLDDSARTHIIYGGTATSAATLTDTSYFSPVMAKKMRLALKMRGAIPIQVKMSKHGNVVPYYGCVMNDMDAYYLQGNATWESAMREAADRGYDNPIFSGAIAILGGVIFYTYDSLSGYLGTPLRPTARVEGIHASGDVTLTVGPDDTTNYTRNFPTTGTLSVVRAADGEREFMTYTGKTVRTFTGLTRARTYGGTASVALALADGDIVTLNNHISYQIGFGAEAIALVWGQYPKPIANERDYQFEKGLGISLEYGVKPIQDSKGKCNNYVIGASYGGSPLNGL